MVPNKELIDRKRAARPPLTELDAVNAIVDAQRAAGESVDPAGAKRFVRALVAVGLLRFE